MQKTGADSLLEKAILSMSDILLGKRHIYTTTDEGKLIDRAKQLGFSLDEIGELGRLYGSETEQDGTSLTGDRPNLNAKLPK